MPPWHPRITRLNSVQLQFAMVHMLRDKHERQNEIRDVALKVLTTLEPENAIKMAEFWEEANAKETAEERQEFVSERVAEARERGTAGRDEVVARRLRELRGNRQAPPLDGIEAPEDILGGDVDA